MFINQQLYFTLASKSPLMQIATWNKKSVLITIKSPFNIFCSQTNISTGKIDCNLKPDTETKSLVRKKLILE